MAGTVDDASILKEMRARWDEALLADKDNRDRALADAAFEADTGDGRVGEDGVWPRKVKQRREAEGRICLTINKSRTITRQVANELRLQPPAISVSPSEDGDVQTAAVIEGLIRSIEQRSKAKRVYAKAGEDSARCNRGFWRVTTDYVAPDSFDQELLIKPIRNPLSVLYDPAAQDSTCRDARYCFVYEDMPREEFEARFKDKAAIPFYGDGAAYYDGEWVCADTIRLAEYWVVKPEVGTLYLFMSGQTAWEHDKSRLAMLAEAGDMIKAKRTSIRKRVCMYLVSGTEVLETHEWAGDRIPIIPVWGEEARVGSKRVLNGVLTYARDAIRMHTFARSANAETIASQPKAPWLVTPKMIEGHEPTWQTAASGNPAVLYYNFDPQAGKPERQMPPVPSQGWTQEALQSADDIKATTGIFDASLGARSNETSGKAIMARQREGDVGTFTFIDNVLDAIEETGRVLIDMIPKVYDAARQLTILGKKMEPAIVAVNQPGGLDLANAGKYDVTVSTGPSVTTQRQETAEALTSFVQAAPQTAPVILPRLAAVLDIPDADELAQELKAVFQPQQPQADPQAAAAAELTAAKAEGQKISNIGAALQLGIPPMGQALSSPNPAMGPMPGAPDATQGPIA